MDLMVRMLNRALIVWFAQKPATFILILVHKIRTSEIKNYFGPMCVVPTAIWTNTRAKIFNGCELSCKILILNRSFFKYRFSWDAV